MDRDMCAKLHNVCAALKAKEDAPPEKPKLSFWTWLRHPFKSWAARRSYKEALRVWELRRICVAMANPLRQRLDYAAVGRQCFQVEQLPDGAAQSTCGTVAKMSPEKDSRHFPDHEAEAPGEKDSLYFPVIRVRYREARFPPSRWNQDYVGVARKTPPEFLKEALKQ